MKIREAIQILRDNGFQPERVKGSHQTWKKDGLAITVICNHMNDDATHLLEKNIRLVLKGLKTK